jgi:ribosomal protein L1
MKKNSKRYKEIKKNSKDLKSKDLKEILELVKKIQQQNLTNRLMFLCVLDLNNLRVEILT